ncbi:hypothetical protein OG331_49090 [Streptomyces sp. NBC_01017]|uniref:Uncharacterized protein n=1 Tax=Streptomyces sp. NBC_00180 TaxID=2903632 RepID=A0AAU1ICV7_9ACTN|nr:hypothetical protein OG331_02885 [Streptomyces sp. NBC_01017]WSV34969.1 hypothetical protein OG331_49090 [Streptomyces sp. NBC_01017]
MTVRIRQLLQQGCQFVVATYSSILLAMPGARILQIERGGTIEQVEYEQAEPVALTGAFVNRPDRFLDRMFAEDA